MYTSELFETITNALNLSTSAENELRYILSCIDGVEMVNDLDNDYDCDYEEEDEE